MTDLKKESKIRSFVLSMESLSVCSKERKIMRLADDDKAVYKLIFHISEIVLGPTISDMRGSTVCKNLWDKEGEVFARGGTLSGTCGPTTEIITGNINFTETYTLVPLHRKYHHA